MRHISKTALAAVSSIFIALFQVSGVAAADAAGVLQTSAGAYAFTPTVCGFHKEDDFYDIEIHGPGKAPDGEVIFFELSSTGNHVVVKLGVDQPFASTDRKIQAGQHLSEEFSIEVSGRAITVPKLVLIDGNGQRIDETASLRIDCGS